FLSSCFCFYSDVPPRLLHSFPTRRSSDLTSLLVLRTGFRTARTYSCPGVKGPANQVCGASPCSEVVPVSWQRTARERQSLRMDLDRKSTRLNSSHLGISYAVFCLKKKNKT